jgi:epoxyqueuosine reductase
MAEAARLAGQALKDALASRAAELGFDAMAVTDADPAFKADQRLHDWLDSGHHGAMEWMRERSDQRSDPRRLWPQVRAVILLGVSTAPARNPLVDVSRPRQAAIATYAKRRDYHDVIKGRLKTLAAILPAKGAADCKVFVDTAPVMEKGLAAKAGLGWQGKHSVLVSRRHGSWLLLGAIYTTAELPPDAPGRDHCGSCRRCLDVCPTDAFPQPYVLDSRRCIAYLTIEHAGPIAREFREPIGNRVFGCDDCLAVCPWNSFAATSRDAQLAIRAELDTLSLAELAALDDSAFRKLFAGTPIKRTGRDRVVRNALIAIGNSADEALIPLVIARLEDASALVRGMAVWALSRLDPARAQAEAAARMDGETDPHVREEWAAVLARGEP